MMYIVGCTRCPSPLVHVTQFSETLGRMSRTVVVGRSRDLDDLAVGVEKQDFRDISAPGEIAASAEVGN